MLEIYGKGEPRGLFGRVDDHANALAPLISPLLLAIVDVLGRDGGHHRIHFGAGWNDTNIHLSNGSVVALRGRKGDSGDYDRIEVYRAIKNQGEPEMVIYPSSGGLGFNAEEVASFHQSLQDWVV